MDLIDYNEQILNYYTNIKSKRNNEFPIFAIEHGLSSNSVQELKKLLKDYDDSENDIFSEKHKFIWIALATEVGYEYEEYYWDLFENEFEKISNKYREYHKGYKYTLRYWFYDFNKEFRGFKPTGDWARKFSVISYPITNSILPKKFQNYLVEALYLYRDPKDISDGSFEKIFKYLAIDFKRSSLFSKFVTEGNLIRTLLKEIFKLDQDMEVIDKFTLRRVINDIKKNELTKHRLEVLINDVELEKQKENNVKIKEVPYLPTLSLRRSLSNHLELYVEIPSLDNIDNEFTDFFKKDKILKTALSQKPYLSPTFLKDNVFKIDNILSLKEPFFNNSNEDGKDTEIIKNLNKFISTKLEFIKYESLLFGVIDDNNATLIVDRNIILNKKYFFLIKNSLARIVPKKYILSETNFGDYYLVEIFVDKNVLELSHFWTKKYELDLETNFSFTSCGVIERGSNNNYFEFLNQDQPIFKISDLHINSQKNEVTKRFEVKLNDNIFYLPVKTDDYEIYFQLNELETGVNNLRVTRQTQIGAIDYRFQEREKITRKIYVRKKHNFSQYEILILNKSKDISYAELFNGFENLNLYGPQNSLVDLSLLFESSISKNTKNILIKKECKLPILETQFKDLFEDFLNKNRKIVEDYEKCTLLIDGGELGSISELFEDEAKGLKLVVQERNKSQNLFYIDDTGLDSVLEEIPSLNHLSFEHPYKVSKIDLSDIERDNLNQNLIKISENQFKKGGCFIINKKDNNENIEDFLIFEHDYKPTFNSFEEMKKKASISPPYIDKDLSFANFFRIFKYWYEAPCYGYTNKKSQVIDAFIEYIYKKIYPQKFFNTFGNRNSPSKIFLFNQLKNQLSFNLLLKIQNDLRFKFSFEQKDFSNFTNELEDIIQDYCDLLNVNSLVREFCLCLAINPLTLYKKDNSEIISIIPKVINENSDFLKFSKILSIFIMTNSEFENKRLYPYKVQNVY